MDRTDTGHGGRADRSSLDSGGIATLQGANTPKSGVEAFHAVLWSYPPAPIPIYLVVRQSAFTLNITLYTGESCSRSLSAEFTRTDDEVQLVYCYRNEPDLQHRHRSQIHTGTALLDMATVYPIRMNGTYFTDRLSQGTMRLDEFNPHQAHDMIDAQGFVYAARRPRR